MTIPRRSLLLIFILCITALLVALFSQHILDMRPCAWCVFQRVILIIVAVVSLASLLMSRLGRPAVIVAALASTALGVGGIIAAWYQYTVAALQFSCEQTFADRFMTGSGLDAALPWLFGIYATCMDARVDLLGIEYALWALGIFAVITVLGVVTLASAMRR